LKILITGGSGFIGSNVCDKLLELGHHVLVIDNYKTGVKKNNASHMNLRIVEGSILERERLNGVFRDFSPEVVIHAAASFKDPNNWLEDATTNIIGTINVLDCAKETNVTKLIYLQTSLSYGLHPIEKPITLKHPLISGGSSYAISKTAAERYIELSGIKFISFRLANVYGPRNLSGPLPTFYARLKNNLSCVVVNTKRDFIFIDDVVNLIIKGVNTDKEGYYHAASGKDHSIRNLFDLIARHLNISDANYELREMGADDTATILLDVSKTEMDLNWKAHTTFVEGTKRTIQWYEQNPISSTYTHLKIIQ